ncbi:hypothetical protein J4Q44_G00055210 [Coregonus suidteri]|uniref:Uncharacterized protein n=1 Tax=Coregonus suidteri TaxID=861788 RepID=A0AAN8RDC3_9TELE
MGLLHFNQSSGRLLCCNGVSWKPWAPTDEQHRWSVRRRVVRAGLITMVTATSLAPSARRRGALPSGNAGRGENTYTNWRKSPARGRAPGGVFCCGGGPSGKSDCNMGRGHCYMCYVKT